MRERPEQILKFVCWGLAALVLFQFIRIILTANPLAHVSVPALPSLAEESSVVGQKTNAPSGAVSMDKAGQSSKTFAESNSTVIKTNVVAHTDAVMKKTNSTTRPQLADARTNVITSGASAGTNIPPIRPSNRPPVQLAGAIGFMPGAKRVTLAPAIQARVNRVTDSEILGPVIHPLPMALLGIAGDVAFLRAPDGQTGLIKEGDELGGIKLLRIGINRVLVEQAGQKTELTIFAGVGGQSLLDKPSEPSHETNSH